jgi:hypothetical protein
VQQDAEIQYFNWLNWTDIFEVLYRWVINRLQYCNIIWFWMRLWKHLLEQNLFQSTQSLVSKWNFTYPFPFQWWLNFYPILCAIMYYKHDKIQIFYLKLSSFIWYTGKFVQKKVVQDIFSPFGLCLTMYEKYFTYPAHKSSQTPLWEYVHPVQKWYFRI